MRSAVGSDRANPEKFGVLDHSEGLVPSCGNGTLLTEPLVKSCHRCSHERISPLIVIGHTSRVAGAWPVSPPVFLIPGRARSWKSGMPRAHRSRHFPRLLETFRDADMSWRDAPTRGRRLLAKIWEVLSKYASARDGYRISQHRGQPTVGPVCDDISTRGQHKAVGVSTVHVLDRHCSVPAIDGHCRLDLGLHHRNSHARPRSSC